VSTFGELLNQYITRAGITDAELARSTGVQRQTIFRWKEGLTARPRYRDDVIRIAAKLRLSALERDELLLAAGFPPEEAKRATVSTATVSTATVSAATVSAAETADSATPSADALSENAEAPLPETPPTTAAITPAITATNVAAPAKERSRLIDRPDRMLLVAVAMMLAVAAIGLFAARTFFPPTPPLEPTARITSPAAPTAQIAPTAPTMSALPSATPIVAQPGEQLLVIAPFVGYTSSDLRFNIAGRIREAVQEELASAQLDDVRTVVWPTAIAESAQAAAVLSSSGAVLVIWGEYDAGRVRAGLSTPVLEDAYWINPVDAPSSLPLVINEDVPRDARVFALYTLGSYYRTIDQRAKALAAYQRALAQTPTDEVTRATLHFYLGLLGPQVNGYTVQQLTDSIYHYTNALTVQPTWENARYNRGTSYLGRALLSLDERADLDAAIADLDVVIARRPQRVDPLLNRGIAYYQRNGEHDLGAARADFTRAIELQPTNHQGYYHRALVEIREGDSAAWQSDLARVTALAPTYAPAHNALCWGYATARAAEQALPHCNAAVAVDETGASRDSRAIALAQLGRYTEAVADLNAYLDWVRADFPDLYEKYRGSRVEAWIAALEKGENPFTAATLDALRRGIE
jgi:tetratricopeptide (TPR) repeat protein